MADDTLSAIEANVATLADALFSETATPAATLGRIVTLATETVSGCDAAGVLVDLAQGMTTAAASAPIVAELHALQIAAKQGPCFEAVTTQRPFYATDLARDQQWPEFAPGAVALGIRSVLAHPIVNSGRSSAINLYAAMPEAFGAADRARGMLLSVFAGVALSAADEHERADAREANMRAALRTRELIGQAQGILMERERITGEQAFALLRDSSQHLNVKLREVAQLLVETGETPETGPTPPSAR